MEKIGGVYMVPCKVNGLPLNFIFDTGASDLSLSITEAIFMLKNGYLAEEDFLGTEYFKLANGDIEEGTIVLIKNIEIAGYTLTNIKASISHNLDAPLLLGQSALSQLGKFEFDYSTSTLIIQGRNEDYSSLSEMALANCKAGNYLEAVKLFQKKIDNNAATSNDYYNLGKTYYNLKDYQNAEKALGIFNEKEPTYIPGFVWRARALSKLDPDSKLGLAMPVYEIILLRTVGDPIKYKTERIEACYYLTFYHFQLYSETKAKNDGMKAINYGEQIISLDPTCDYADKSTQIIKILRKNMK